MEIKISEILIKVNLKSTIKMNNKMNKFKMNIKIISKQHLKIKINFKGSNII